MISKTFVESAEVACLSIRKEKVLSIFTYQ